MRCRYPRDAGDNVPFVCSYLTRRQYCESISNRAVNLTNWPVKQL